MRVGIMYDDDVVHPHPPISAALEETVAALKRAGHEIIRWQQPSIHKRLVEAINKAYFLDSGEEYYEVLADGNEPPTELMVSYFPSPQEISEKLVASVNMKRTPETEYVPHLSFLANADLSFL
jgi:amidase